MITDYASLQLEAARTAQRNDLASIMPDMVQLAENELFRRLELRQLQITATGTTAANTIPLQSDVGGIVSIVLDSAGGSFAIDYLNTFDGLPASDGGPPSWYTIDSGAIRLYPSATDSYAYTLRYWPKLVPLSDSAPTNWLVLNAPDVYLYATCVQIGIRTHDDALITRHQQFLNEAINSVRSKDARARFPRQGGLQIRPRKVR